MAITFDLPPELHERVRALAATQRRSLTQTLVIAVEEYVHRHSHVDKVDALSERIVEEDAELLRRLA
jgi:predicted transcriptional regulator